MGVPRVPRNSSHPKHEILVIKYKCVHKPKGEGGVGSETVERVQRGHNRKQGSEGK